MRLIILLLGVMFCAGLSAQSSSNPVIIPEWESNNPTDSLAFLKLKVDVPNIQSELDSLYVNITDASQTIIYNQMIVSDSVGFNGADQLELSIEQVSTGFYRYDLNIYRQGKAVLILSETEIE